MRQHSIRLKGSAARGSRVDLETLAELARVVLDVARRSLRLRTEGRSHLRGAPAWLLAAAQMDFAGLSEGSTLILLEAPTLAEVAPDLFAQERLFEDSYPHPEDTAFTLVQEGVSDAVEGNRESDRLDRNVLCALGQMSAILDLGFEAIHLGADRTARHETRITAAGMDTVNRLYGEAPPDERVVVAGKLDQITHSKRSFRLILPGDGPTLRGILPEGEANRFARFFGRQVVVDGHAVFRPSGGVSVITAQHIQDAAPEDMIWARAPRPSAPPADQSAPVKMPSGDPSWLEHVLGHWPGSETDAEVQAVLESLS